MEFKDFNVEELAIHSFFIQWVKNPDPETTWFWESFLKEHPEKAAEIESAKALVLSLKFKTEELPDEAISNMRHRILLSIRADKAIEKENTELKSVKLESKYKIQWRWAAVLALPVVAIAFYLLVRSKRNEAGNLLFNTNIATENRTNPKGQKSVVLLSDGSKVWLNADSRITYSKDFNSGKTREVYLEGEAFFDVVKNPGKPFLVHTSAISIKVLGTAFNVKSYSTDKTIETTLVHGKVSIDRNDASKDESSLVLKPNQRAIYSKTSKALNIEQVVAERTTEWKNNKLVFDDTPFSEAIAQLERWYDVTIHIEQSGDLSCGLTADLENEKLEDVLKLLETSHQVTCTVLGKEVFVKGTLCK